MLRKHCSCLMSCGGGEDSILAAWPALGADPVTEIVWPIIYKEGTAKTHFLRLMARPFVARALKKTSQWRRCVCISRELTQESSMYANTPSRLSVVQSIIRWKVWAALDSQNGMNKYSNKPNSMIIAIFLGGCLQVQQELGDNPWQGRFLKKRCNHASRWKGLACLARIGKEYLSRVVTKLRQQ